jgi:hypothetical protein
MCISPLSMSTDRILFKGAIRMFTYMLRFETTKNTYTGRPRIMDLYIQTQITPPLKITIFFSCICHISIFSFKY